jgi:hypothetical protein
MFVLGCHSDPEQAERVDGEEPPYLFLSLLVLPRHSPEVGLPETAIYVENFS